MLAFLRQGPYPGPLFRPPEQRASDADRDTAVGILCAAAVDGRLTMTELDERVGSALTARTLTQLARWPLRPHSPLWPRISRHRRSPGHYREDFFLDVKNSHYTFEKSS